MVDSVTGTTPDPSAGVNTESGGDFNAALGDLQATFETAQVNSARLREVGVEEGSELAAAKKQPTPV